MIDKRHENYIRSALSVIKECSNVSSTGSISYTVTPEYPCAKLIIDTLTSPEGITRRLATRCLDRALKKYVVDKNPDLNRFKKLFADEIRAERTKETQPFEILRSCHSRLPLTLKVRKQFNSLIRTGEISNTGARLTSDTLSKSVLRAIKSRQSIESHIESKNYLPPYSEGNLYIAARVHATNEQHAIEIAEDALGKYLALLNFVAGFGRGLTWDVNPVQPQGVLIPSPYITLHYASGKISEKHICYEPDLSLIRPEGKHVKLEIAKRLDDDMDFVLRGLKNHFDSEMVWDAIRLLGESYLGTNENNNFMKSWMVIERLSCFSASESHKQMLDRLKFIQINGMQDIESGVLESLRNLRNNVAHKGFDISSVRYEPLQRPTSALVDMVNRLLHFHLHLPNSIRSKDDFIQFTRLPVSIEALNKKRKLITDMLSRNRQR